LELRPDIDSLDALAPDRDAQWARLQATTFLTDDEKRATVGYGPKPVDLAAKLFNPDQPRDDRGRWSGEGGGAIVEPTAGKKPYLPPQPPATPPKASKERIPGQSGQEAADDIPSWARGKAPTIDENGDKFARRLLEEKYPGQPIDPGPSSDYNRLKKFGDRAFRIPQKR
jgi:hypothetical protein